MGFTDGLVVLAVLGGFGFMIYSQLAKKNPKINEWVQKQFGQGLFKKNEGIDSMAKDKIEQVYDERRSMM